MPKAVTATEKEADILRSILSYLRWRGILHWRTPVQGTMRSSPGGEVRFSRSPVVGFPDIAGVISGRFFAMEVKTAKGRLSDFQAAWLEKITAAKGRAAVVRSLAEAEEFIKNVEDDR